MTNRRQQQVMAWQQWTATPTVALSAGDFPASRPTYR
jgi:hypothetical protein